MNNRQQTARAAARHVTYLAASNTGAARARFRVGNGDQFSIARIDALTRFRLALRVLGRQLTGVVYPVVCEGVTVSSVAAARNENHQGTAGALAIALEILADHYELPQ
ncbi:MAG: hypothetical protein HQL33_08305 [Alphaproteobacteria bacterium]|nr:hypothetical protein [Alphaproteobacteria bacterium]